MEENIEKSESEQKIVETAQDNYIEAIKEMKQNSVDKEVYNKLLEENKQLLNTIVNGNLLESTDDEETEPVDIDKLREDLFNKESNNLEYISNALKLREELINRGEPDPFLPNGHKVIATDADVEAANRVADVLTQCVEYADGDNEIFTDELQRRLVDTMPPRRPQKQ